MTPLRRRKRPTGKAKVLTLQLLARLHMGSKVECTQYVAQDTIVPIKTSSHPKEEQRVTSLDVYPRYNSDQNFSK